MNLQTLKDQKGFTIVELLIVIVVIGILAAITIVAFNGVQNQAKTTKAQAVASDVQKKAEAYNATVGHYPISDTAFAAQEVSKLSSGNTIGTPSQSNGDTTAGYTTCPASATATNITGARITYWNYSDSSAEEHAVVGSC